MGVGGMRSCRGKHRWLSISGQSPVDQGFLATMIPIPYGSPTIWRLSSTVTQEIETCVQIMFHPEIMITIMKSLSSSCHQPNSKAVAQQRRQPAPPSRLQVEAPPAAGAWPACQMVHRPLGYNACIYTHIYIYIYIFIFEIIYIYIYMVRASNLRSWLPQI